MSLQGMLVYDTVLCDFGYIDIEVDYRNPTPLYFVVIPEKDKREVCHVQALSDEHLPIKIALQTLPAKFIFDQYASLG